MKIKELMEKLSKVVDNTNVYIEVRAKYTKAEIFTFMAISGILLIQMLDVGGATQSKLRYKECEAHVVY